MKNNKDNVNKLILAVVFVAVFSIFSSKLVRAEDLTAVPPALDIPAIPNVMLPPVDALAPALQNDVLVQQAPQETPSTQKDNNKTDTKKKSQNKIEDENEQVFDEDKEAYVEDNRRVYPKWQSNRKKPVKDYTYSIKVNKNTNTVTIYIKEESGKLKPYKAMVCSVGREGHDTPEGKGYHTSDYYDWRLMVDNTYGRYAVRFNGSIMFHSVPYYKSKKNSLEWKDYNKLGGPASLGCIRLAVADAKWIFDNCKRGTEVEVYSGPASTDPLGTPTPIRLDLSSEYRDWDPTDLTPDNPWLETIE